jgi:hypothetical protein
MAVTINASTSAGLVQTADTSGVLQLQTNSGTTALTIDTSQNVGIGTASPSSFSTSKLVVNQAADGDILFVRGGSTRQLELGTSSTVGYINVDNTSGGLGLNVNTTERMRIDSSGNVLVGTTTAIGKFTLTSSGNTSGTNALSISNSSGTELFYIRDDGAFRTGKASVSPYNNTAAVSANAFINTDGTMLRATSSLKYKKDIENASYGLSDVLKLRPVTYKGLNLVDGDKVYGGLIAEEVHDAGLTQFVQYAEDGTPDSLAYGNMVSLLTKAIQDQQTIINDLKARITALEGAA